MQRGRNFSPENFGRNVFLVFQNAKHAQRRMAERGVTELEVEQTVLSPDRWYYGEQGEINAVKDFGVRRLRVAHESTPSQIRAITVIEE